MKRAKPPKKKKVDIADVKQIAMQHINRERYSMQKENMDKLMNLVLPVVSLACKDELKLTHTQLERVNKRFERYMDNLGDGLVSVDDVYRNLEGGQ